MLLSIPLSLERTNDRSIDGAVWGFLSMERKSITMCVRAPPPLEPTNAAAAYCSGGVGGVGVLTARRGNSLFFSRERKKNRSPAGFMLLACLLATCDRRTAPHRIVVVVAVVVRNTAINHIATRRKRREKEQKEEAPAIRSYASSYSYCLLRVGVAFCRARERKEKATVVDHPLLACAFSCKANLINRYR